jgi:hypothetical protein
METDVQTMEPSVILDLKQAQQTQNSIITFKNHLKQKYVIHPLNSGSQFISGNILEFSLKGHGLDYINLGNSYLTCQLTLTTPSTNLFDARIRMPLGTAGLINRVQVRIGSYDIQDIQYYGQWFYWSQMNKMYQRANNLIIGIHADHNKQSYPSNTEASVILPVWTCLDNGGYLPIYNLAEDLRIRIYLATPQEALAEYNLPLNADVNDINYILPSFLIEDPVFIVDGLIATQGSILTNEPYVFASENWLGFKDIFTQPQNNLPITHKISFDIKKTSVKKNLCVYLKCPPLNIYLQTYEFGGFNQWIESYYYSMGGQNFPYSDPVDEAIKKYVEFLKYNGRDNNTVEPNYLWNTSNYNGVSNQNHRTFSNACICGNFDRLPYQPSIISGLDTERYPIQEILVIAQQQDPDHPPFYLPMGVYNYFCYNTIIKFVGGEIKTLD